MDKMQVASAVAESLLATEATVEKALGRAVALMREMMDARRALGLPVSAADPALRRVSAAVDALGVAQREVLRTHGELEALGTDLGLRSAGFGPLVKPTGKATEPQPTD